MAAARGPLSIRNVIKRNVRETTRETVEPTRPENLTEAGSVDGSG